MKKLEEARFIAELEKKAREQREVVKTEMLPEWAKGVGEWLVVNPWRLLVPISAVLYSGIRFVGGEGVVEITLSLFGGYQ